MDEPNAERDNGDDKLGPDPERGRRIKQLRRNRGWTQAVLMEKVDVSERWMSSVENGGSLSLTLLFRIARVLEVEPQALEPSLPTNRPPVLRTHDSHVKKELAWLRKQLGDTDDPNEDSIRGRLAAQAEILEALLLEVQGLRRELGGEGPHGEDESRPEDPPATGIPPAGS